MINKNLTKLYIVTTKVPIINATVISSCGLTFLLQLIDFITIYSLHQFCFIEDEKFYFWARDFNSFIGAGDFI